MIVVGLLTLTLCTILSLRAPPPDGFESWAAAAGATPGPAAAGAQLVLGAFGAGLLLYTLLTQIVVTQVYFVAVNVTTRELIKYQRDRPVPWPWQRNSGEWEQFAPYDEGIVRNVVSFLACTRDEARPEVAEMEEAEA
eukprot:156230-Prymnesium_polylepis.1